MCNGQSHFHINSLHSEGKSSTSSWIKGLLYCIKLPVSFFNHCVLFFLTQPRPNDLGCAELQVGHCSAGKSVMDMMTCERGFSKKITKLYFWISGSLMSPLIYLARVWKNKRASFFCCCCFHKYKKKQVYMNICISFTVFNKTQHTTQSDDGTHFINLRGYQITSYLL